MGDRALRTARRRSRNLIVAVLCPDEDEISSQKAILSEDGLKSGDSIGGQGQQCGSLKLLIPSFY